MSSFEPFEVKKMRSFDPMDEHYRANSFNPAGFFPRGLLLAILTVLRGCKKRNKEGMQKGR